MDLILKTDELVCYEQIFEASKEREETSETVVPDVMPDVDRVLCAAGTVVIRSKECAAESLAVTGSVAVNVLYVPEDSGGVRALSSSLPFSFKLDAPGVTNESVPVTHITLGGIEARLINPRRVLIRASVHLHALCYERRSLKLVTGMLGEESDIETMVLTETVSPVLTVQEKTFVVSDEYPLAGVTNDSLLAHCVYLRCGEVHSVGTKLIVKGAAKTDVVYLGSDGAPCRESFETEFSQIFETDREFSSPECTASLQLTAEYVEAGTLYTGEKGLNAELHLVAQLSCADTASISYMADCYSLRRELSAESEELTVPLATHRTLTRETLRETVELPAGVDKVILYECRAGRATLSGDTVSCPIFMSAVYSDSSGALFGVARRFNLSAAVSEPGAVSAECADAYVTPGADGLDVRVGVDISVVSASRGTLTQICSATASECCEKRRLPSVTVIRPRDRDTLWQLSKRYHSTCAAIKEANALSDGEGISGRVLIIPTVK